MSSPIAVESDAIPITPLCWTERNLEEMNITILDMPTGQIADPASLRSHLSWGRTRDTDTTDIVDTGRRAWYNDFCFLLVEWRMERPKCRLTSSFRWQGSPAWRRPRRNACRMRMSPRMRWATMSRSWSRWRNTWFRRWANSRRIR